MNGISDSELDRLKQDIMTDIRKELQKFKLDIIEGQYQFGVTKINFRFYSIQNGIESTIINHLTFTSFDFISSPRGLHLFSKIDL